MKKITPASLLLIAMLAAGSLACNLASSLLPASPQAEQAPQEALDGVEDAYPAAPSQEKPSSPYPAQPAGEGSPVESEFPLPEDVQNYMEMGAGAANFQTSVKMEDLMAFYRETLTAQGYTEREILTSVTASTFSMVFDGAPNGMALVIQAVNLGNGAVNVNIRYEDV